MRKTLAMAVTAIVLAACQPTPTSTITATAPRYEVCRYLTLIQGTVTPANGSPKVVLQRTIGGKWVDWQWYDTMLRDEKPTRLVGVVNQLTGAYAVRFRSPDAEGTTLHLRVRSDDNTSFSPGVYMTTRRLPSESSC